MKVRRWSMAVSTQAATLGLDRSPRLKKPWMQGRWYSSKYVCRLQSIVFCLVYVV